MENRQDSSIILGSCLLKRSFVEWQIFLERFLLLMSDAEMLRSMQQYTFASVQRTSASIIVEQWIGMLEKLCK